MKREEAPKEEKKIIFFLKIGNGRRTYCKERRKKETEQLLLAVSEQMVAIEQLHVRPELLYQYIQKYKSYIKNMAILNLMNYLRLNYNNYKNFFQI